MSYSDDELYAIFAETAYKIEMKEKNELLHNHYGLFGYEIDEDLTTKNSTIILTPKGDTIISYRGTDPHNPSDLVADANIALGLSHLPAPLRPSRFREAEETYQKVKDKYPDREIKVASHSLGASQGLMIAKEHGLEGFHYNTGASLLDAGIQLKNFIKCSGDGGGEECDTLKKQHFYTTGTDILSISMLPRLTNMFGQENVKLYKAKKDVDFLHHSLAHFLPEPNKIAEINNKETKQVLQEVKNQDPIKFVVFNLRDPDSFCLTYPNHPACEKSVRKIKYTK